MVGTDGPPTRLPGTPTPPLRTCLDEEAVQHHPPLSTAVPLGLWTENLGAVCARRPWPQVSELPASLEFPIRGLSGLGKVTRVGPLGGLGGPGPQPPPSGSPASQKQRGHGGGGTAQAFPANVGCGDLTR